MSVLEAFLLGLVQGISEFLPVSSSGHLAVFSELLDLGSVPLLFDVLLHVATLCSVLIVFRKKIGALFLSLFRFLGVLAAKSEKHGAAVPADPAALDETTEPANRPACSGLKGKWESLDDGTRRDMRWILALLIATAATGVLGLLVKDFAEHLKPAWISVLFVVTGILLILSGRMRQDKASEDVGPGQALFIGLAQGVGVLPGLSRSGITISAALFAGVKRSSAGEFSFLLSIPAIAGAFVLELGDAGNLAGSVSFPALAVGMATAFVSGLVSMKLLLRLINRGKLGWFACYLIPAGIAFAVYFLTR